MKKPVFLLLFIAIAFIFCSSEKYSQTINEKLIVTLPAESGTFDAYSLKYDRPSGAWVYVSYDTTSKKYTLITKFGSSQPFNYAMQYNSAFDKDGNVYTIANENVTDSIYKYYFLKNSDVIGIYDNINEGWSEKDGVIYFAARSDGKERLYAYDTKSGNLTKGKAYDQVRLVFYATEYAEAEPAGYVCFTKDGTPYYSAVEGDDVFLVIGTEEQKHYSDISWYEVKFDGSGSPCYIAKSSGKFYDQRGSTLVVQGSKEYKAFDWIYGPLVFDNSNNPIYVGQDSTGEYKYRSSVMKGPDALKTIDGSVFNYVFSPSGKLTYIASIDKKTLTGEYVYKLIYDGKEGDPYNSISNIQFAPSGEPVIIASDKNNKYFVVQGSSIISEKFDYIADYRFLPNGTFTYIGTKYGNYDKKIPDKNYVYIDGEESGPYDMVSTIDYVANTVILGDKNGNYAYVGGKNTDKTNYYYKYTVYTNKWTSKPFDNLSDVKIINGKFIYLAGSSINKELFIYNYRLYVDNKPVGDAYSAYSDLRVDPSGTITFIASKGNNMYLCEVKL